MRMKVQEVLLFYGKYIKLAFFMAFVAFLYALQHGDLPNAVRVLEVTNKFLEVLTNG